MTRSYHDEFKRNDDKGARVFICDSSHKLIFWGVYNLPKKELEIYGKAEDALAEMDGLTKLSPAPISVKEFCLKPENIDLKGLCK